MKKYFITEEDFAKTGIPKPFPYRLSSPVIKSKLFNGRERLVPMPIFSGENTLCNIKACDLASLPILDFVFINGNFQDPIYLQNRENTVIISSDCTDCLDTCFCTLVGNNPYPEKGFDINISPIMDGYILTIATERGEEIIDKKLLKDPTENQLRMVENNRESIKNKVRTQVANQGYNMLTSLQEAVMNNFDSPVWEESAKTCVECGGCNFVCPTCHCFILSEHNEERYRQWDACQYKGFALVAGGANPRKRLYQRLRNRYVKKFDFFQKNIGLYACTGCGRCIRACIGKIDMRQVLKRLIS